MSRPHKKSKKSYIKRAHSKEPLRTFSFGAPKTSVYPDFPDHGIMELYNKEPVVRGAVNHFVDKCMEGDFSILKKDTKRFDAEFQERLRAEFNFRTDVVRKVFLMGKLYNNAFIEIVFNSDKSIKALNVLDSGNVDAETKPNGDLIKLTSKIQNPQTGDYAVWEPSEIIWVKFNDASKGWAPADLRSLWETVLAKDYIRRYTAWLWETGQYRVLYSFENSSDQDIENFLVYARKHDSNYMAPFIAKGTLETKMLRDIKESEDIDRLMKYYDNQIAIALRVPPVDLGIPDSSGRSNADAQTNNFNTHVRSWKTVAEDTLNFQLFPKMNKGNSIMRFGPNDRFVEKQVYEVVQMMKAVNFKDEVVQEYLFDRGIVYSEDDYFNEPEVDAREVQLRNPRELDTAPSRAGKDEGQGNSELEEISTREDQISSQ